MAISSQFAQDFPAFPTETLTSRAAPSSGANQGSWSPYSNLLADPPVTPMYAGVRLEPKTGRKSLRGHQLARLSTRLSLTSPGPNAPGSQELAATTLGSSFVMEHLQC